MKPTHPDEIAFLAAIARQPEDDTVRLVYADWFDEHSEPIRALAIRRGVADRTRQVFAASESAEIQLLNQELFLDLKRGLLPKSFSIAKLAPGYPGVQWIASRGLIEAAACSWQTWLQVGDDLLRENWCPEVMLMSEPRIESIITPTWEDEYRWYVIPGRNFRYEIKNGNHPKHPFDAVLQIEWPDVVRWRFLDGTCIHKEPAKENV